MQPSVENVESGTYPFYKDLAFVLSNKPSGRLSDFIGFVLSDEGRRLIRASGYLPSGGN